MDDAGITLDVEESKGSSDKISTSASTLTIAVSETEVELEECKPC